MSKTFKADIELNVALPGGLEAARAARRALDPLARHVDGELLEDVRFLVNELVTNSIRHAGVLDRGSVRLKVAASGSLVRAEVLDSGPGFEPHVTPAPPDDVSGRGLFLVQEMADRWGVRGNDETCVWFEIGPA